MQTSYTGKLLALLLVFLLVSGYVYTAEAKKTQETSKIVPRDYPILIGCRNQVTGEIKKPLNSSPQDWGCFYGKNWKNLMFPSKSQYKTMQEVYKNRGAIVTALVLINHESQFNSKAKWRHKWWCDHWLLQIRDIYGGAKMSDKQQMEWFKKRKEWQISPQGNCYHRVLQKDKEKLLRCVFARHNGVLSGQAKYPSDRYAEWQFYNGLSF